MNTPTPALVSQRAAQRLPRPALLLFCAAYVLPGLFGRSPWKNADIIAFGHMMSLVRGQSPWLAPALGGVPGEGGVLPYWLGALFIRVLSPWVDPALAARIPFALLLLAVLALLWYATFHLARNEDAQPVPFAFGGEAKPVDYARSIADGSVLALISALGLLQLGHETTPELAQLAATALLIYGLAAAPFRPVRSGLALFLAPVVLAASTAPTTAVVLALAGAALCLRHADPGARRAAAWLLLGLLAAIAVGAGLGTWAWRQGTVQGAWGVVKLVAWFCWPVWPLAAWTLWRWRRQLLQHHVAVPLVCAALALLSSVVMGASDRALMLALPGMAILAAFALPTLQRSVSAAIDWFSVFFFTGWGLTFWVTYASMQLGWPAQPAVNVGRLLPGFVPHFSPLPLLFAVLGSLAWVWLVGWRTGRHRHPMWKSLVLPAGGVAVNWLLAMTLMLPALDYAFTYEGLTQRIARHVPAQACIDASALTRAQVAALELAHRWQVRAEPAAAARCDWRLLSVSLNQPAVELPGWQRIVREARPGDRSESLVIYRRP